MEEKIIIQHQDPKGLYLLGLGNAVKEICIYNNYYKVGSESYNQNIRLIEIIHAKAMEVIKTETPGK